MTLKTAYVCGPLTELNSDFAEKVKDFYKRIAEACQEALGLRAFVPHEHYDPIRHGQFTPKQVDQAERDQVCNKTSVLIVVAIAPSWGGGIEVEMANQHDVPVVILIEKGKRISRLLRGNPAVKIILEYTTYDEAITKLKSHINALEFLCV